MADQNINTSTWIKKYITTDYITVATILIYGCGILYNYVYYKGFGINITKYLSLQETLVDTSIFIAVLALLSLIFIPAAYYLSIGIFNFKKNNRIRRYVSVRRRINNKYYLNFISYWMIINYLIAILIYLLFVSGYTIFNLDFFLYVQFIIPILGISTMVATSTLSQFKKGNVLKNANYFIIGSFYLMIIYVIAVKQSDIILTNKSNKKEVISLSSGVQYTTNDSILYIGETSSTLFLYNKPLNNTIIINKENVLQIELIKQATIKIK